MGFEEQDELDAISINGRRRGSKPMGCKQIGFAVSTSVSFSPQPLSFPTSFPTSFPFRARIPLDLPFLGRLSSEHQTHSEDNSKVERKKGGQGRVGRPRGKGRPTQ